jgi:methylenetetrahydrofolate dehydrogenase (NADP+)/methenyltetrahydrofolate cyclohydrolase
MQPKAWIFGFGYINIISRRGYVMLIYGKEIRDRIKEGIKQAALQTRMAMTIIQVGEEGPSTAYINGVKRFAQDVAVEITILNLPADITENELLNQVKQLNEDPGVIGIMVQKPLPEHIDDNRVVGTIDYKKDVEGIHPFNLGKLLTKEPGVKPCTPKAVIRIIKDHNINIVGERVTIVGRSPILGGPLAVMMTAENGTVTVCHTRTRNLAEEIGRADIVVAAMGKSNFITADMVKEGAVIIDAGINFDDNGNITGDVHPDARAKASFASAVPGGVGMITTAELFDNLRILAQLPAN